VAASVDSEARRRLLSLVRVMMILSPGPLAGRPVRPQPGQRPGLAVNFKSPGQSRRPRGGRRHHPITDWHAAQATVR
jgi:hypothetical protein